MDRELDAKVILGLTGIVAIATLAVVSSLDTSNSCRIDFEESSSYKVTNQTTVGKLQENLFDGPEVKISEGVENGADKGKTSAYYIEDQNQFYIVQHGTIAGDQFYGPFNGDPRNCEFENWP